MKKIFSTIDMPKTNKNKDHKENDDHGKYYLIIIKN